MRGLDRIVGIFAGSRNALVALIGVGVVAGIMTALVSSAMGYAGAATARFGPGSDSGSGSAGSYGRDSSFEIPKGPPAEPEWKLARRLTISAPWQFSSNEDMPKIVYLTFDDGPYPEYTPKILQLLADYEAKATFFQLGEVRAEFPELVEQVVADGHSVANHGTTHVSMTELSLDGMRREVSGGPKSKCFRPPYGATNGTVRKFLREQGMRSVLWDIDTMDWGQPGADTIERNVMKYVHPGAIVLMHDGGGDRTQTVEALSRLLPKLAAKGYQFHALPC